jgi:hypothetical protein
MLRINGFRGAADAVLECSEKLTEALLVLPRARRKARAAVFATASSSELSVEWGGARQVWALWAEP